jgi:hypothetical protein
MFLGNGARIYKTENTAVGIRHSDALNPQKLALTSPTIGGRSVGIVRSRTQTTNFSLGFRAVERGRCVGLTT